jgi:Protein of unknown function (DUF1688)
MAATAPAPSRAAAEAKRAPAPELAKLRNAAAVRERCGMVHRFVVDGHSAHFTLDENRLPAVATYVAEVTRAAYPDLKIPYHSRWRHFAAGGVDRWAALAARMHADPLERARSAIDLATVSVLLDAGAGDAWRYAPSLPSPASGGGSGRGFFGRSEGLAVASVDMFRAGAFSSDARQPLRVDAVALARIDPSMLARHFQVDGHNPLVGVEGRSALLNRLGAALTERPDLFGRTPARPGHLLDYLLTIDKQRVAAAAVLAALLDGLSTIWPSGLTVQGIALGDSGRHLAVRAGDATDGIVPFHKLSQWLTYSLLEPLETAGLKVERLDELTALPEYRNGGLLVDLGVIRPRTPIDPHVRHQVSSELVVEWRALTVALMDRLLEPVRRALGVGADFAMPHMLQGGTWAAGRKIARELRPPEGASPIPIAADGTVF